MKRRQDLKDRYYSCCRKLIRNRPWSGDDVSKSQFLNSYQFDKGPPILSYLTLRLTLTPIFRTRKDAEELHRKPRSTYPGRNS